VEIDGDEAPNGVVGFSRLEGRVLQLQAAMWHLLDGNTWQPSAAP